MTDQATFITREVDGFRVLDVRGEIDLSNAGDFRGAVRNALDGPDVLLVTLSAVDYLDSSALGVLIQAARHAEMQRRKFLLVAPRELPAGKLLRIAGVDQMAPIFESVDDALASVRTRLDEHG